MGASCRNCRCDHQQGLRFREGQGPVLFFGSGQFSLRVLTNELSGYPPPPRIFGIIELGGKNAPKYRFETGYWQSLDNK